MKLWQKIFLCVFSFVLLGIDVISLTVLSVNHKANLQNAKEQAVTAHQYVTSNLSSQITYKRMEKQKIILSEPEINEFLKQMVLSGMRGIDGIYITYDGKKVTENQWDFSQNDFESILESPNQIWCSIHDTEHGQKILTASAKRFEGREYHVFCLHDVSNLYESFDAQFKTVQWVSAITAGVLGLILLLLVWYFLRPLKKINQSIQTIALGKYQERIDRQGSVELQELSQNINTMAESIQANDAKIREIADGRKRFADSLAHEMKTPLTSILGFADILRIKKEVSSDKRQEYAGIIVEEAKRLQHMSEKLLQISVTEHTKLELVPLYLPDIFSEIREIVSLTMKERDVKLVTQCDDIKILADKELFLSLVLNFIDNAGKASGKGQKVILKAIKENKRAHIIVQDFGIGMTKEECSHILEPFYMADKARSRKHGGAGLGLALCAEIIKKLDMQFDIETAPEQGTTIHLWISLQEDKES